MTLYIAFTDAPQGASLDEIESVAELWELQPGLYLVHGELTRSEIYHALKREIPGDAALLVAPLANAPKFKSMSAGSTSWLRGLDIGDNRG